MPANVTTGMSAFFSACSQTTRGSDMPLTRASLTYSESSTSSMLEVLDSEYVKLARVKGMAEPRVVWLHALKNALIPVVTFAGIYFSILVTTAIVVETVFAWPGLGRLTVQALLNRDFPVVMAAVSFTSIVYTLMNLVVDLLYSWLDPRVRLK